MADDKAKSGNEPVIYFEFIKNRWYLYAVSLCILIGTPLALVTRGLNWGMDFRGGTEFLVRFDKEANEDFIRTSLEKPEFKELGETQVFKVTNAIGEPNFSIRTRMQPDEIKGMPEKLARLLSDP